VSDFIYDFVIITISGGVIVGLILIALQKIKINTLFFFRLRLRRTLNKYILNSSNVKKERKYHAKLGKLIDKALKKRNVLEKLGFQPFNNRGIGNDKFRLYFKRNLAFTIRDLKNSQVYFSMNIDSASLKKSVDGALYNFIEHLKE